MSYQFDTIGVIQTPFSEKFGMPRQPRLTPDVKSTVILDPQYSSLEAVDGLQEATHLWLIFVFSECYKKGWKNKVRPPRLGGNKKLGVFATRSTFRPNSIGMSVVEFGSVSYQNNQLSLIVQGIDLLDGTPILDIKPYVPYADSIERASGGVAQHSPELMDVTFTEQASCQLDLFESRYPKLAALIQEVLSQDPRPAYHKDSHSDKTYGMSLYDLNIHWQVINQQNLVLAIQKI